MKYFKKFGNVELTIYDDFFDNETLQQAQQIAKDVGVNNSYEMFTGKRCDLSQRYFITKNSKFSHRQFADKLLSKFTKNKMVRIEVCNDIEGFWLKPHNDHPERKFSMVIYVNGNGPGTTFYDKEPYTVEWKINRSIIFNTLGLNTYDLSEVPHGVDKQPFDGIRSTIIVSFIDETWKALDTCYDLR